MRYLIDGHNLIPKIQGMSLKAIDDETELIDLLQTFSRINRVKIEVYFDQAAPGFSGTRKYGTIRAHFIPNYSTADNAIKIRLHKLANSARQWTVITSDRQIQVEARSLGAAVLTSEEFAQKLQIALTQDFESSTENKTEPLSEDEIEEWLKIFSSEKRKQ